MGLVDRCNDNSPAYSIVPMRTSEQIRLEIKETLGFVPPFFDPAQPSPQVLDHLWQQTLSGYINNPLPGLFKEKLSAYLSRYCAVPYCMICHSCSLYPYGVKAQEVLQLLESPPPLADELDEHLSRLATYPEKVTVLPQNSELEQSLLYCSIYVALEREQADYCRSELQRLLGTEIYQYLVMFIAYIKTCHVWMEAHPEVTYETDRRVLDYLNCLLEEEPGLGEFFDNYRERVKREQQNWTERLAVIAERKRNEEALRKAAIENRRLAKAIASVSDGVLITDPHQPDNPIIYLNPAFSRITGYEAHEVLGRNCRFLQSPATDPEAIAKMRQAIKQHQKIKLTLLNQRKNGQHFWNELRLSPVFSEEGDLLYFVGIQTDITERQQAEAELQLQGRRSQLFADVTLKIRQSLQLEDILQTAVIEVQKVLQADRALVYRLWPNGTGSVVTEAVGQGLPSILGQSFSAEVFPKEYRQLYNHGRLRVIEDVKKGKIAPCLVDFLRQWKVKAKVVVPILLKEELWGLLIVHQCSEPKQWVAADVELLQQLADQIGIALAQAQLLERETRTSQELAQSNAELQQFAAVASHDLQEPLRKVQAFGNRLQSTCGEALTEQGQDYLERMQNAAQRMQVLIDDLLALSRVTSKAQPFVSVDLATVTKEVLSDLEVRLQQTGGRVELGELPTIQADPLQMRQLLQNLISNALKFQRSGEPPVVKIDCRPINNQEQPASEGIGGVKVWQITVQDNGIGFDEKYLNRIFNVFQRLHSRSEYEGTGIGLTICRKIAERHGGSITAQSTPGQGAKFIVTLPSQPA